MVRVPLVLSQRLHVNVSRYLQTGMAQEFRQNLCVVSIRSQECAVRVRQSVESFQLNPQLLRNWFDVVPSSQMRTHNPSLLRTASRGATSASPRFRLLSSGIAFPDASVFDRTNPLCNDRATRNDLAGLEINILPFQSCKFPAAKACPNVQKDHDSLAKPQSLK